MKALVEKINFHFRNKLPFAAYCLPNSDQIVVLLQRHAKLKVVQNFTETGFVFAPFAGDALYISEADSDIFKIDLPDMISPEIRPLETISTDKDQFTQLVRKGINEIRNDTFQKVVLSRQEQILVADSQLEGIIMNLFSSDMKAFRFCFYSVETGFYLGATPEKLLSVSKQKLTTMALAATQPFLGSIDVLWGEKEKEEQQFVADYICDELQTLGLTPIQSDRFTAQAGNILHLRTDISANVTSEVRVGDIVKALHPTPAVCGLPTDAARQFILRSEPHDRGFYSGYLGLMNIKKGEIDLFVNLRSMKIENGKATLFMGCGITLESDPEAEYIETVNKSMAMKRILSN